MNLNDISKSAISSCCECPESCRKKLLKGVLMLLSSENPQDLSKYVRKLASEYTIPQDKLRELLGLFLALTRLLLETTEKEFNAKLLDFGFPEEFIQNLPLVSNRAKVLETVANATSCDFFKLVSLKWRVDLSLYNSSITKKIPISIMMTIQLQNGKKYTVSMDVKTFHKLRFHIAHIMKEMIELNGANKS